MIDKALEALRVELNAIAEMVNNSSGEKRPLNVVTQGVASPGVDREDLVERAKSLAEFIRVQGPDELSLEEGAYYEGFIQRLAMLKAHSIPNLWNGNGGPAVSAYLWTLDALERALRKTCQVSMDERAEQVKDFRAVQNATRAMQARCDNLKPTFADLERMAKEIVAAYQAADQLPTDMANLRESRQEISKLQEAATVANSEVQKFARMGKVANDEFEEIGAKAKQVLEWSENAMRSSTAVGLAVAFHDRAEALRKSMWPWVVGLIIALLAGATVGGFQLHGLADAIQSSTSPMIVWTRLAISMLSVGGPIWFAWLSTKQIGQRFRLAEDYAYKASISKAYEGYRREALELDEDFQKRLFASALTRLDEQPLRFVENETHGSPWHELANSKLMKEAIRIAPELVTRFRNEAKETVEKAQGAEKDKPTATAVEGAGTADAAKAT
ncbi:hypothetical protein [Paraburkholderia domus]|uniref:hypothetical protein n=1 Tax=Paraburkholderia domus TaxID=2793075 RepID=UPI001B124269|nr:hypothetical protein [Paraburkholderia domus]CAE6853458.1 hypothetical protein R75483_07712 [Paraburkholderia domus]